MTEEEAKTKWCPMARMDVFPDAQSVIMGNRGERYSYCIGSACMMWDWRPEVVKSKATGTFHEIRILETARAGEFESVPRGGDCGLKRSSD